MDLKQNGQDHVLASSTKAIHGGSEPKAWNFSPIIPPLYLTTTYETLEPGKAAYEYSRCDNPTRSELQKYLASLEDAKFGLAFSSGLGALTTTSYLLESGQHVLCSDDVYGGTNRFYNHCLIRMGIETTFVSGVDVRAWTDQFRVGKTKLVWIESPTNPLMKIVDIAAIVRGIKDLDSECVVVVDNTFMSPILQSPLKLGADIVMHSCTKYINGHSDVIMGALMINNESIYQRLKYMQNALGIVPSAYDCFHVIQSIRTLDLRVRRQSESAMKLATFLDASKYVKRVLYPGIKSHPQHDVAKKQFTGGFGGMITFILNEKDPSVAIRLVQAVKIFHLAVSLGCVCSFIQIPSLMTHSAVSSTDRDSLGIHDNLLRISVGLEDVDDLIADMDQALIKAVS